MSNINTYIEFVRVPTTGRIRAEIKDRETQNILHRTAAVRSEKEAQSLAEYWMSIKQIDVVEV